jgi:hypothetical protein
MERNFYTEGFESFLKDKADQYKLYPSEKVWKNINRQLHPRRKWPYLTAALLLLGIGIGGKFYLDDKTIQKNSNTASSEKSFATAGNAPGAGIARSRDVNLNSTEQDIAEKRTTGQSVSGSSLRIASLNPSALNNSFQQTSNDVIENDAAGDVSAVIVNPLYPAFINPTAIERTDPLYVSPSVINADENRELKSSSVKRQIKVAELLKEQQALQGESITEKMITSIKKVKNKTEWQIYVTPSVSYRKLVGKATDIPFNFTGNIYNTNSISNSDVNLAVHHKPSMGLELGTALVYPLTKFLRVKAGLQLNYNRYDIRAYNYKPEVATFGVVNTGGISARSINTVSYYRNYNGNSQNILKNERFMLSIPLGIELELFGNDRVKFNVASSIQPTYVFNTNSYLISTNLKNYAKEPRLVRDWNVNAGMEAFLSIKTGKVTWVTGPQVRYQLYSSYKDNYPISEHLIDYGFKVGVTTTLK